MQLLWRLCAPIQKGFTAGSRMPGTRDGGNRRCALLCAMAEAAGRLLQVEKLPGGSIEDCRVLKGVMFQKDVVAPGRMRRKIAAPRVLLLDCPLEYKKGENQTNVELTKEEDWCARWATCQTGSSSKCLKLLSALPVLGLAIKRVCCGETQDIVQ